MNWFSLWINEMSKAKTRKLVYILLSLLGAVLVGWGTTRGPGIGGDATIYITSAKNFAHGEGLGIFSADGTFRLIPYFPPFFPLVLSLFSVLGLELTIVARMINTLLFAGTIYLVLNTSDEFISDWGYIIALGFLFTLSPVLNPVFSWAMSEPLSIFLGTYAMILALKYFQHTENNRLLYISAVLAGFSTLTRYGAIVYTAVICLQVLIFIKGKFSKRLSKTFIYGIIAMIPVGIWAIVDILLTETVSSRSVNGTQGLLTRIVTYFTNMKSVILFWILPDSWIQSPFYPQAINTGIVILFILVLLIGVYIVFHKLKDDPIQYRFHFMLLAFCILYVLMTLVISLATYPPITIGTRMFSPMYLMIIWLVVAILYQVSRLGEKPMLKSVIFTILLLFTIWNGFRGFRIIQDNHQTGLGFNSVAWQTSDLIEKVNQLPDDQIIVSNEEMAILALTGRMVYPFAEVYYDTPLSGFTRYGDGLKPDKGEILFKDQSAYLVLFDSIFSQFEGLYGEQSEQRYDELTKKLEVIYQGEDGWIYRYPSSIEE
jgi:hypothetical protein